MLKKIIIIFLCVIVHNNFCETSGTEKEQHYTDPMITAKQLDLLERQAKFFAESSESLYSTKRVFITGGALAATCGAIGGMIHNITSDKKQSRYNPDGAIILYALTCTAITALIVAKEIKLSDNLKFQQSGLTSAINNLQKPSKTDNSRPDYTVSGGSTFIKADGSSSIRL